MNTYPHEFFFQENGLSWEKLPEDFQHWREVFEKDGKHINPEIKETDSVPLRMAKAQAIDASKEFVRFLKDYLNDEEIRLSHDPEAQEQERLRLEAEQKKKDTENQRLAAEKAEKLEANRLERIKKLQDDDGVTLRKSHFASAGFSNEWAAVNLPIENGHKNALRIQNYLIIRGKRWNNKHPYYLIETAD